MSIEINGVDLDAEAAGKWWGFTVSWPFVSGWCAPAYRAELIEAVTGVSPAAPHISIGGDWLAEYDVEADMGAFLGDHDFTFAGTSVPLTGIDPDGEVQTIDSDYHYRLIDGTDLYAASVVGMRWGTLADGENRFIFNFCGIPHLRGWSKDTSPKVVRTATHDGTTAGDTTAIFEINASDGDNLVLYVFVQNHQSTAPTLAWYTDFDTKDDDLTEIKFVGSSNRLSCFRLVNPSPSLDANSHLAIDDNINGLMGMVLVKGADQTTPERASVTDSGTGSTSSLSITGSESGDLLLDAVGYNAGDAAGDPDATGPGQTQLQATHTSHPAGQDDQALGVSSGSSAPTWALGASESWRAIGLAIKPA